jgi:putative pyruvate formate lyase activating enzyme
LGRVVESAEFARICLALQERGAENINIVTGSHTIPAIAQGIDAARAAGLRLPVLWNSSAYESLEAMELLKDRVDMYLPDLKTLDSGLAARFFKAPDYPEIAAAAILKMMEYRPGQVLVRHLILPGCLESTRQALRWFAEHAAGKARLSLMSQYTPVKLPEAPVGPREASTSPPSRFLNQDEYQTVLNWLEDFGIEDGFYQELSPASDWLPDFERANPFSSDLSLPVWHWKEGFL